MSYSLTIERVDNGYILNGVFNQEGDITNIAITDGKDWDSSGLVNYGSAEELLWEVIDYFSLGGTKYDEFRMVVKKEEQK